MKGTLHVTAETFDGREVFASAAYGGPSLDGALPIIRRLHPVGAIGWVTAKGAAVDPQDVNPETFAVLTFDEETP